MLEITLAQVKLYAQALGRMEADNLKAQAIAVCAGLADEKG
ncbi:hypothetical protein [Nitrosomonas communis]|nr:hypothetical protein [Nitrosomonas communis]